MAASAQPSVRNTGATNAAGERHEVQADGEHDDRDLQLRPAELPHDPGAERHERDHRHDAAEVDPER